MTKKIKISFLIVVWSIVAIQMYVNYQEKNQGKVETVTAFSVADGQSTEEIISGYGYFGTMEITEEIKKQMLENLANKLGITDGYRIQDGKGEDFKKKTLIKDGKYAVTTLQIISMMGSFDEPDQYIVMDIRAKENMEGAVALYQKMKRVYEEIGVDGQVSLEITVERDGDMQTAERNSVAERIFDLTQAKEVDSIRENDIFTVYGYTRSEDSHLELNGKKVNIQVAMFYDEGQDKTYIKIGMPIVNTSY